MTVVLRFTTSLNAAGPGAQVVACCLASGLDRSILLTSDAQTWDDVPVDASIDLRRIPVSPSISRFDLDRHSAARLLSLLDDEEVSVVETHNLKAAIVTSVAMKRNPNRLRAVHCFHTAFPWGSRVASTLSARFAILRTKAFARCFDVLVAGSDAIRDQLLSLGVGTHSRWVIIPMEATALPGPVPRRYRGALRKRIRLPEGAVVLASFARINGRTDFKVLIDLAKRLDPSLHIAIVGEAHRASDIRDCAERAGVTDQIHIVGWWADLPWVTQEADIVIVSSESGLDGAPLRETALGGTPLVAVTRYSFPELFEVPHFEAVDSAAEVLSVLAGDESCRTQLGRTLRLRAVGKLSNPGIALLDDLERSLM